MVKATSSPTVADFGGVAPDATRKARNVFARSCAAFAGWASWNPLSIHPWKKAACVT
jgi:hypothetical protein